MMTLHSAMLPFKAQCVTGSDCHGSRYQRNGACPMLATPSDAGFEAGSKRSHAVHHDGEVLRVAEYPQRFCDLPHGLQHIVKSRCQGRYKFSAISREGACQCPAPPSHVKPKQHSLNSKHGRLCVAQHKGSCSDHCAVYYCAADSH